MVGFWMKFGFFRLQHRKLRRVWSNLLFARINPRQWLVLTSQAVQVQPAHSGSTILVHTPKPSRTGAHRFFKFLTGHDGSQHLVSAHLSVMANHRRSQGSTEDWMDSLASSWIHLASKQFLPGPTTNKAMAAS